VLGAIGIDILARDHLEVAPFLGVPVRGQWRLHDLFADRLCPASVFFSPSLRSWLLSTGVSCPQRKVQFLLNFIDSGAEFFCFFNGLQP